MRNRFVAAPPEPRPRRGLMMAPSSCSASTLIVLGLFSLSSCGDARSSLCEVPRERDANELLSLLQDAGIEAEKSRSGGRDATWDVEVDPLELTRARRLLEEFGLPREGHRGLAELFDESSLIPDRSSEHARLLFATGEELALTLERHERVLSARVHIVQPEPGLAQRLGNSPGATRPTASVLIRYRPSPADARPLAGEPGNPLGEEFFRQAWRDVLGELAQGARRRLEEILPGESSPGDGTSSGKEIDIGQLTQSVLSAIESGPGQDLLDGLSRPEDSGESLFLRLMLRDFYRLPPAQREVLETRFSADDPDWPFGRAQVRALIAGAVDGLWPWDVNVIFSPVPSPPPSAATSQALDTARFDTRLERTALALALSTLVLFVLLARERRRNAELVGEISRGPEA